MKAAVEIVEAQRDQYFVAYRAAVLKALEEVDNAIVSLAQERLRRDKLGAPAKAYREAASISRSLYQSASASCLNVLDAERSLYSAEDALIQSRVTMTADFIALNNALGAAGMIQSTSTIWRSWTPTRDLISHIANDPVCSTAGP